MKGSPKPASEARAVPAFQTQRPCQVADVCLYFLQDELIKYVFDVRGGSASTEGAAGKEAAIASRDFGMALTEEAGFNIGVRLMER